MSILLHFMNKNVRDKPEKWETSFVAIRLKYKIGNKFRPSKSSMGTLFQPRSSKNQNYFTKEYRIPPIEVNNTLWILLLKNNICGFYCQKLLNLSKPENNQHHKCKLTFETVWRQKCRQTFLPEGLPPICCQFVILLKT